MPSRKHAFAVGFVFFAWWWQMLAGLCGSIAAATVGVPVECIKHRVQVRPATFARSKEYRSMHAVGMRAVLPGC
eukprot:4960647-Pleurochrysis_carterae.AAC.13